MTRSELKSKIQSLVKSIYSDVTKSTEVDIDDPSAISLDTVRFPVLAKFPTLKDTIVKLLTEQYELFLKDIEWVAPRPTTFRIILANDQVFYLIYTDRTWIAKVEGKKYYLLNLSEEEAATEAIARILAYGITEEKPGGEETPAETPTEEPAAETPTPEEEA